MSQKSCKGLKTVAATLADDMKVGIERLAGPRLPHDTRESWLRRGARRAGISLRAAQSLFYRQQSTPSGGVVWRVMRSLDAMDHEAQEAARNEYGRVVERIEQLEKLVMETADVAGARSASEGPLDGRADSPMGRSLRAKP